MIKGKCPSCGQVDDYESRIDVCKKCNRGVKLIVIETPRPSRDVRMKKEEGE
jgi:hypothetical protein